VDWTYLVQDRERYRDNIIEVISLRVPYNAGNLLTN
jgi:hypothetical protein